MTSTTPSNFIFVALPCEAKPLIQAWRLKKSPIKQAFAIYRGQETVVVIAGIGKIAMAAAVAYTMAQFADVAQPIMLNIGIAGHPLHAVGSCFLADKITDAETQRRFYPQLAFDVPCRSLPLKTLSKPDAGYADFSLCDMEASAFYEIAVKFGSSELIHCLKVVSDNEGSPLENIDEESVRAWIAASLTTIENLLSELSTLKRKLPAPSTEPYEQLLGKFHFTATNASKLHALVTRWQALNSNVAFDLAEAKAGNARDLLAWLERQLEEKQFYL